MPDGKRAFMMGNALVVGLVERVAAADQGRCRRCRPCQRTRRVVVSWRDSSSLIRRPAARPSATLCARIGHGIRTGTARCAALFAKPV